VLLLAGAQILGGDVDDAVGVDVERDLDLRHAAAGRGDAVQMEAAQRLVGGAISRSPCRTLTSTEVWLSAAVEKIWLFFTGMVVLRSMSLVNTPPRVSMPRLSGVTSSSSSPFHVAGEHAALQGCAHGHALVGVDALEGLGCR
jgi:hypothetical protein